MESTERSLFSGVYHGAKVFITGHTGFKGAWLALWLHELGAEVAGYSVDVPTVPSLFEKARIGSMVDHQVGDVRDFAALKIALDRFQPSVVFHLAAQSLVRRSYRMPKETIDTNVMGTVNLMEAVRHSSSVKSLVIVTSDKCYEEQDQGDGYREEDRLGGKDPYSASKGMAELATASYLQSYYIPGERDRRVGVATARAGNVIGGGDWSEDRLVPDCIRAMTAKNTIEIRNPSHLRPWQFVLEPLSGYLLLGEKLLKEGSAFSGPWNFGPVEERVSTRELVEKILACWGGGSLKVKEQGRVSGDDYPEAEQLLLCWEKAKKLLGWKPAYTLDQAVQETTKGYQAFQQEEGMRDLCARQIKRYAEKASAQGIAWAGSRGRSE